MTDLTRDVDGVNIFISCHGGIGSPQLLRSRNLPQRIPVPNDTTFHFYTEPGDTFWCPIAYDFQQKKICKYIYEHNGKTTGINFSVSNGYIPNFILEVEPIPRNFMSRVVVCNRDGTISVLFDMNDPQIQSTLGGTSFTLQDILALINTRRIDRLRLGANDRVHFHCMFCQAGTVPQFWRDVYDAAIVNDNRERLIQIQSSNQPSTPLGPNARPMNQVERLTQRQLQERQLYRTARQTAAQDDVFVSPQRTPSRMNESNTPITPIPGQGARTSALSQTFSSQPVLPSQPGLPSPPHPRRRRGRPRRLLFSRERGQGRGREENPEARREDIIIRSSRQSRTRREASLRRRRKK